MTVIEWGLVAFAVWTLVHLGAQGFALKAEAGNAWAVGPRDVPHRPGPLAGRLRRALDTWLESAPAFLALALVALVSDRVTALAEAGVLLFLAARAAYLPAYASGIPWLRTVFGWAAGIGLLLMLAGVVGP